MSSQWKLYLMIYLITPMNMSIALTVDEFEQWISHCKTVVNYPDNEIYKSYFNILELPYKARMKSWHNPGTKNNCSEIFSGLKGKVNDKCENYIKRYSKIIVNNLRPMMVPSKPAGPSACWNFYIKYPPLSIIKNIYHNSFLPKEFIVELNLLIKEIQNISPEKELKYCPLL